MQKPDMLDSVNGVETPEGVGIAFNLAGPCPRAMALIIDGLIRTACYIAVAIPFELLGHFGNGVLYIMLFIGEWFYPVFFEVLRKGQTPGKKSMRLMVIKENGSPVTWEASLLRNLLRTVDFMPVAYGFGLISTLTTQRFQRLGDLVAGTVVVYQNETTQSTKDLSLSEAAPPKFSLDLVEQRAIIAFGERETRLNKERLTELADIVEPLTGQSGDSGLQTILSYANWFLGRRK